MCKLGQTPAGGRSPIRSPGCAQIATILHRPGCCRLCRPLNGPAAGASVQVNQHSWVRHSYASTFSHHIHSPRLCPHAPDRAESKPSIMVPTLPLFCTILHQRLARSSIVSLPPSGTSSSEYILPRNDLTPANQTCTVPGGCMIQTYRGAHLTALVVAFDGVEVLQPSFSASNGFMRAKGFAGELNHPGVIGEHRLHEETLSPLKNW